jgi:hypothetical protein
VITREHGERTAYTVPRGLRPGIKEVVRYAAEAYGFLLNTSERRRVPHTWPQFADLIAEHYAVTGVTAAVVATLRSPEVSRC